MASLAIALRLVLPNTGVGPITAARCHVGGFGLLEVLRKKHPNGSGASLPSAPEIGKFDSHVAVIEEEKNYQDVM
ncbi:hypothetical protein EDB84DRAFT_1516461 [Lactarius hengduanensis]|nr:hypothetical protein EDB84DRAFT_1516461 [Lactarius hengduanensis]